MEPRKWKKKIWRVDFFVMTTNSVKGINMLKMLTCVMFVFIVLVVYWIVVYIE